MAGDGNVENIDKARLAGQTRQKDVGLDSLKLGGHIWPGGDRFEHDLAVIAPYVKQSLVRQDTGARIAFVGNFEYADAALGTIFEARHPVIVIEGESGYIPTTFDIGSTPATIKDNVRRANAASGLTDDEADRIVASSFGKAFEDFSTPAP